MAESSSDPIEPIRQKIRSLVRVIARYLDRWSGGHITPTMVTITGLLLHIPIVLLIASHHNLWAALFLIVFGLFDTLDGELARLQKRVSLSGMLLDSATDRLKEIMIYTGITWQFAGMHNPYMAVWAVIALGASLWVSYINAWGEVVAMRHGFDKHDANKAFRGGLVPFEVRMTIIIVGLITNLLAFAVGIIAILATITALTRLVRIIRYLNQPQVSTDDKG